MRRLQKHHGKAFLSAAIAALSILGATALLERSENRQFGQQQRTDALDRLSTIRARVEAAINTRLLLVEVLVVQVAVNREMTQAQFAEIATPLLDRYPGIRSINLAKNSVISHIYPLPENQTALGLNLVATPEQKQAVDRTIASKKSVVAGPVELVQGGVAFINRAPIFTSSAAGTPEYWGLASILVSADTIYGEAGLLDETSNWQYAVRGKDGLGETGEVFFGNGEIWQQNPVLLSVTLPNGSWQLAAIPPGGWLSRAPISIWLRGGGGAIALLAGGLVFVLVGEPARLQLAVERATAALRQNEAQLQQANGELSIAQERLAQYNRTLERQVSDRTQALSETLEELQTAQDELVQSEKMAALGQLIAGVAHEINTPLGAIRSSVGYIDEFLHKNLHQFPAWFRTLTPEREGQFFELLDRASQNTMTISGRQRRKLRQTIVRELEEQNIANATGLANILLDLGVGDRLESFYGLFHAVDSQGFLKIVRQFVRWQESTRDIQTASERATKVVFALKTYARYNRTGKAIEANLIEGLEAVLTLYKNQIKQGVTVIRQYQDVPKVMCYFDDLNQVWTNLIHNALQAMENRGTLTVAAVHQDGCICVSIADTGIGIDPKIEDKIFQPFFTTKPPGEGTGLGLDIVQKIVDKHQGRITFHSVPGNTSFTVNLPAVAIKN